MWFRCGKDEKTFTDLIRSLRGTEDNSILPILSELTLEARNCVRIAVENTPLNLHVHDIVQGLVMPSTTAHSFCFPQNGSSMNIKQIISSGPQKPDLPYASPLSRYKPATLGCLRPGAVFCGTQSNRQHTYDVRIEFTNVNLDASTMGGYLKICGLTDECPEITTYFDGEIIGPHYKFATNKWNATVDDDMKHWPLFPHFNGLHEELGNLHQPFDFKAYPYIFMRWKEQFLVPDHHVSHINGASFAGFYYIYLALDPMLDNEALLSTGTRTPTISEDESEMKQEASEIPSRPIQLRGYYFHESSEPFQKLALYHVPARVSDTFELQ